MGSDGWLAGCRLTRGKSFRLYVHRHLEAVGCVARIEPTRQRAFGHQSQRIGSPLRHLARFGFGAPGPRSALVPAGTCSSAASTRNSNAPTSGVSRPRSTTMPSSSTCMLSVRLASRTCSASGCAARSTRRHPRTSRSTCAAVALKATASSRASVAGVATRVSARTFE